MFVHGHDDPRRRVFRQETRPRDRSSAGRQWRGRVRVRTSTRRVHQNCGLALGSHHRCGLHVDHHHSWLSSMATKNQTTNRNVKTRKIAFYSNLFLKI